MADIGKPAHFGHILYLEGFIGQERFRFFHTGFDEIRFGRTMKKTGVIGIKLAAAQVYKFSHGIAVPFLFAVGEYEVSGFLKLLIKTGGFRFADGLTQISGKCDKKPVSYTHLLCETDPGVRGGHARHYL